MSTMTLSYRPIQYIEDAVRGEGRNIGVIAYEVNNAYCRFMGETDDCLDTSRFASLSKVANESSWVFGEWAGWFRSLVNDYKEHSDSMLCHLENLAASDSGISVGQEATIEGVDSDNPVQALEWLYSRLVTEPTPPRNEVLKMKINHILHATGIKYREGFEQDIEIEFTPQDKTPVRVRLPYALTASPKIVFKVVRFQTGGAALVRQINDAIVTFLTVVEHGFTEKNQCVVLTDKPPAGRKGEVIRLAEYGTVVDITRPDAITILNAIMDTAITPAD